MGAGGVRFCSGQHGGIIRQLHRDYHHSDGMGLNLLLMLVPLWLEPCQGNEVS